MQANLCHHVMYFKMTALFYEKLIQIAAMKTEAKGRILKASGFLRTLARCPLIANRHQQA